MQSSFYPTTQHYILSLNPSATYEWERCTLHNPITSEQPDFARLIAQAVEAKGGKYLVAVTIEVKVLEESSALPSDYASLAVPVPPSQPVTPELVA